MNTVKKYLPVLIGIIIIISLFAFLLPKNDKKSSEDIIKKVRILGDSMEPNYKNNDIVLLKKYKVIKRFDVILFNRDENNKLVKRVIGLPGETIEIKRGNILINDEPITNKNGNGDILDMEKITLLEDEFFALGDNYDNSLDSRFFGPIKKETIKGIIEKNK